MGRDWIRRHLGMRLQLGSKVGGHQVIFMKVKSIGHPSRRSWVYNILFQAAYFDALQPQD